LESLRTFIIFSQKIVKEIKNINQDRIGEYSIGKKSNMSVCQNFGIESLFIFNVSNTINIIER